MKGRFWVLFFLLLIASVGFYAYKNMGGETEQKGSYFHYQTDDFRVMDIPLRQVDYSPLVTAIFYSHLREGKLPLTFVCTILTDKVMDESLVCRLEQGNVKIVKSLVLGESQERDGHYVTEATFLYDLSDMLKEGYSEDDVMSFLKSLQKGPKEYIKYLGNESNDKKYSF